MTHHSISADPPHMECYCAILDLGSGSSVTSEDVRTLQRDYFADRSLTRREIDALFAVEATLRPACDAWSGFFIQAVVDHAIWGSRPTGIVDTETALWLLDHADRAPTAVNFAVLVSILEEAHRVPTWFRAALRVRAALGWPGLVEEAQAADLARAA